MESLVSITLLFLTAASYLLVAIIAARGISTQSDYLLGNRQFNISSITLTLIATQLGAGMLFGTASEAFNKGLAGMAYNFGMAAGLIVLGCGLGGRLRSLEITTTAELFEKKYGSIILRKFAAFISVCTMAGILAAQMVASRQLFSTMFALNDIWLVIFWLCIITYTMFGGLKAVIATDKLQVLLIVSVFSVVFFYVVPISSMGEFLNTSIDINKPFNFLDMLPVILATVCFSIIEQDLALRFFAAKDKKVANISAILSAIFLLLFAFIPIFLGMYAKALDLNILSGQSPLIAVLQTKLSPLSMTAVACAMLAAICSTADSLLGAASTNLIVDFSSQNRPKSLLFSRATTMMVGIGALIIAFYFDNVIAIIIKSYEISISALFIPLIIAMFVRNTSTTGAYLSVIFGLLSFVVLNVMGINSLGTIYAILISFFSYQIGYLVDKFSSKK